MSADEIRGFAQHLNDERNALLDSLEALSDEQLSYRPKPDDWSTRGIAEHLMISEWMMLELCPDLETIEPKKHRLKAKMMFPVAKFILDSNISVAPPPGSSVTPKEKMSLADIRIQWDENQGWLQRFVHHFDSPQLEAPLLTHPLMGPLPTLKLLKFVQIHFNYHQRQIDARLGAI